jgi:glucose-6-phosphate-specific signal transduction histidine kinase
MLDSEQHALVRLLHDDLGQNLVAIKSFAAAIAERHAGADGDTEELAGMIREAAESAYRSSYDLMQELRAQYLADREIGAALEACLAESRLKESGIAYNCDLQTEAANLDFQTRAFILRAVRCYANLCKTLVDCRRIVVDLRTAGTEGAPELLLILEHGGQDSLDPAHFSLRALGDRLEVIGGEMRLDAANRRLEIRFDRLEPDSGSQS